MNRTITYENHLIERLKNLKEAEAYLNAALEDEDSGVLMIVLKDLDEAHKALTKSQNETN